MIPNQYEGDFRYNRPPLPDVSASREILRPLSRDVIPVIYHEGSPTLGRFLNEIIRSTTEKSRALLSKEVSPDEIEQDVVFFVGSPGSGKSYSMKIFDQALQAQGIPDEHINKVAWEKADERHLDAKTRRHKARPLESNEEMYAANIRAYQQFNEKKGWVLARAEYVPIVMRNETNTGWEGRDGGATCIESIVEENKLRKNKRKIFVAGLGAEARMDATVNVTREEGAYPNQIILYKQVAISLARKLIERNRQLINRSDFNENQLLQKSLFLIPDFVADFVVNKRKSNPLQYEDFLNGFGKVVDETAQFFASLEEKELEDMAQDYPLDLSKLLPLSENERNKLVRKNKISTAYSDCESLTSLFLMNHIFTKDLNIPSRQIFMGMMAPSLRGLQHYDYNTIQHYIDQYSASNLGDPKE